MKAVLGELLGPLFEAAQGRNCRAGSFLWISGLISAQRANPDDASLTVRADALFGVSQANQESFHYFLTSLSISCSVYVIFAFW